MNVCFTPIAWQQYNELQKDDRKLITKINQLIKDIERNGLLEGIGKPEALKYIKACSRRINDEHRLVYNFDENNNLIIFACKGHYED